MFCAVPPGTRLSAVASATKASEASRYAVCTQLLNWQAALDGLETVRRLPGPLRLRRPVDEGWLPGLYTSADHAAHAAEPKPKRSLRAALAGKSRGSAESAAEFV